MIRRCRYLCAVGYPLASILARDGGDFEITIRCSGGRALLTPSTKRFVALLAGIIGRAQFLYGVVIYAYCIMPTHIHLEVAFENARQATDFKRYVFGNIAKLAKRVHGVKDEAVFGRRNRPFKCLNGEATLDRLAYVLSNSVKEALVDTPYAYPGLHSARAMVTGQSDEGIWVDREKLRRLKRSGVPYDPTDAEIKYPIKLTPIPAWAHLPKKVQRRRARNLINKIVRENREARAGRPTLGARAVRQQDPHSVPNPNFKKLPAPLCFAGRDTDLRRAYMLEYRALCAQYRDAAALWRETGRAEFPDGALLPGGVEVNA